MAIFIKKNGALQSVNVFTKSGNSLNRVSLKSSEKELELLPPVINLYDDNTSLEIESQNDYEDEYEIYVDDVLIGTYNKFYDFESDGINTITKCIGKEYYTGEIIVPSTIDGHSMTTLSSRLFNNTVANKITISEGITTASVSLFNVNTTTVNISFPSTIEDLKCLQNYPHSIINIGLPGYIEYGWTTEFPQLTASLFEVSYTTVINFYIKDTITTLGNYSLSIKGTKTGTTSVSNTRNLYFDTPASTSVTMGTNLLWVGASKNTVTYNVYTDNASIKDALSTYAGQYCTVNVYKRNGGNW